MYSVTFFKRSQFIYRTVSNCSGYFIRRFNWRQILESNDRRLCNEFKDQLAKEYEVKIMKKMNLKKSIELARLSLRADFESHKFNSGLYDQVILKSALREQMQSKTPNPKNLKSGASGTLEEMQNNRCEESDCLIEMAAEYEVNL
jgi:hypothetical protein